MKSTRIRFSLFTIAIALMVAGSAHAAPVVWYIDTAATNLGIRATGITTITPTVTVGLKMIAQGVTPFPASITPTISIKLGGQFVTETDFSSTIQFLSGSGVQGLPIFNAEPLPFVGSPGKAPADYAGTVMAKVGPINTSTLDVALRNSFYDLTSAPLSLNSGSFAANGTSFGIESGRVDFRGYGISSSVGSGNLTVTPSIVNNTTAASGSLSGSGSSATLTIPITATITQTIASVDGQDTVFMKLFYSGTIVARTYAVPEPSSLCLSLTAIAAIAGESYRRRRRSRLRVSAHSDSEPGT